MSIVGEDLLVVALFSVAPSNPCIKVELELKLEFKCSTDSDLELVELEDAILKSLCDLDFEAAFGS